MSAKIFISPSIIAIPQPDFEANRDGDNGAWQASQSFLITKGKIDDPITRAYFGIGKSVTMLDPNAAATWGFLNLRRISVITQMGGWEVVRVDFNGIPSVDGSGNPIVQDEHAVTYAMRGQVSDAPLQEHPKFKALTALEKNALGKLISGEMQWGPDWLDVGSFVFSYPQQQDGSFGAVTPNPITSSDGVQFANRIAEGVTTYRKAGFTWSKRWASENPVTATQLNSLQKIVTTPPGSPPKPGTGREFLLVSALFDQTGETDANPTFTNELVFELSDEDGWDSFLQS